jgi:HPr kinase/phosphorylase
MPGAETIHATLVAKGEAGVLLRGKPGAGKSDLALRLLGIGPDWQLVGDDQVTISRVGETIIGRSPAPIAGKLEVRGVGIVDVETRETGEIRLIIDLVPRKDVPRMPEPEPTTSLLGVQIAHYRLHGLDASSPSKIDVLLRRLTTHKLPQI